MDKKEEKKRFRFSIRVKTIIIIALFGTFLAEIAMVYFSISSSTNNQKRYKEDATELSTTIALSINTDNVKALRDDIVSIYDSYDVKPTREQEGTPEFDEYMAKVGEVKKTDAYLSIQKYLHDVKEANIDTEGIYLGYVDYDNKLTIYLVYDAENELYPVGIIDPLYEEDYPICDDHMLGFVASIYESEYEGYLCTAGAPIVDKDNNVLCYALVDINLANMRGKQAEGIVRMFIYLASTVALLCVIGILIINRIVLRPVKTLKDAAETYDVNKPEETHEKFKNIRVNTHDEFADLAENMKKMENDINTKIVELQNTNAELVASQRLASQMVESANKDALTGVRNKSAYDKAVVQINKKMKSERMEFGIAMVDLNYLKNINDDYGHAAGDAALIKLCNLICAIFVHSPVYRVGGDEFVVLLRNTDYANSSKLIDVFNSKIEELRKDKELEPYERISAAIGYSTYDPELDNEVEDVFKKADLNMYIRKRDMKKND